MNDNSKNKSNSKSNDLTIFGRSPRQSPRQPPQPPKVSPKRSPRSPRAHPTPQQQLQQLQEKPIPVVKSTDDMSECSGSPTTGAHSRKSVDIIDPPGASPHFRVHTNSTLLNLVKGGGSPSVGHATSGEFVATESMCNPYNMANSFATSLPEDLMAKSQLTEFPQAVAAISEEGHLLGLNEAIPEKLRRRKSMRPVHVNDNFGQEIVLHSAAFVLAYAAHRVLPKKALAVRHGYCLEDTPLTCGIYIDCLDAKLSKEDFVAIQEEFEAVIELDLPITPIVLSESDTMERLLEQGSDISYQLLKSKNVTPTYNCYEIDGYITLRRRPLMPSSSMMQFGRKLEIVHEGTSGIVLRVRGWNAVPRSRSIDAAFERAISWGNSTRTRSVGEINDKVLNNPEGLIRLEETRFDNEVMNCAMAAVRDKPQLKIVLISGPSASGKTTFANKLALSFKSLGRDPVVMSTDDYYRDSRDPDYPKQPNGQLDFEVIDALRLPLLRQHMTEIMAGHEIIAPVFDMVNSRPKPEGVPLRLGGNGLLIMEGIFTLDPKLQEGLDEETKNGIYTIFISPMPFFFLDEQSFIANSIMRLIRRIARDYLHRGRDAAASIKRLQSVSRGEVNAVLPHISNANYFFNSAMAHELPILRVICVPLLRKVVASDPVYPKAQQIIKTLIHITSCSDRFLQNTSLLREFVGGSVFEERHIEICSLQRPITDASANTQQGTRLKSTGGHPMELGKCLEQSLNIPTCNLLAAMVDGVARPLSHLIVIDDCDDRTALYARPITVTGAGAASVLRATMTFLMHVAVRMLWPKRRIVASHGFGAEGSNVCNAYFIRIFELGVLKPDGTEQPITLTDSELAAIEGKMQELISKKAPILVRTIPGPSAMEYFVKSGMNYTVSLLQSRNLPVVDVVMCQREMALYFQPLAPHAGYVDSHKYALSRYGEGYALSFAFTGCDQPDLPSSPACKGPLHLADDGRPLPPVLSTARTDIQENADEIRFATRVSCVGDMNKMVFKGECGTVVQVSNATFQRRMNRLVNQVKTEGKVQVILIAGPSSSGKSVLTEKLTVHLRAAGIATRELGMDNYFKDVGCDDYPKTPSGAWDYEAVEAIKKEELERDVQCLLAGNSIDSPVFDLGAGKRKQNETMPVKGVPPGGVLILEGIFALHDSILPNIPREKKLLVVVHPTSILNIDELRFVSHQVLRMLRRIVRDYTCRRRDARESLTRWRSVAEGEDRNVMPFIDQVDVMFNASTIYEIGALKSSVLPLLEQVSPLFPEEYEQAQSLRALLQWYHDIPDTRLPQSESVRHVVYGNEKKA